MFLTGLVSISFRQHTVEEIIAAVRSCGLQAIEWGSDVHVLPGDRRRALEVREKMQESGLQTAAYGSYYSLGESENPEQDFLPYLHTAQWLNAPVIRIWGGKKGSSALSAAELERLAAEAQLLTRMAGDCGVLLSLECHPNTLTDDANASLQFLQAVGNPYLTMYWQPNQNRTPEYNLRAASLLAPVTTNLHVFSWEMQNGQLLRFPLAYHTERWQSYLQIFRSDKKSHALLLEFMHDDRLETLPETAAALLDWATVANGQS